MKFGPIPVREAEGAILAHSLRLDDSRIRKGTILSAQDIERLSLSGVSTVVAARLDPGEVGEDEAAAMLAAAMVPDPAAAHLRVGPAATGRANIHATAAGVVEVDAEMIHDINKIDPMITVATVPEWQRMTAQGMVATVKIISYAVPGEALAKACAAARGALRLRPIVAKTAKLIQSAVDPVETGDKGHQAMATRLDRMGVELQEKQVVAHREEALADAIAAARADVILILTGSATSDVRDVAPEALRRAGGSVTHFGMPVDPGNLLFYGELRGVPVIGLPGCARSPALNGADWVLERILCGVPVTPADIARMGVGGLLKEVPARGRPREP